MARFFIPLVCLAAIAIASAAPILAIKDDRVMLDGRETKLLGLRCSNSLASDASTSRLIRQFPTCRAAGLNTVSVFFMGSRIGDVKGYRPDAS